MKYVRVFRSLGERPVPVLEIGRLRLWARPNLLPTLYCHHKYGAWLFGIGYLQGMLFDRRGWR